MTLPRELQTDRLRLRRWLGTDRVAFAALNADARVMQHFPAALSRDESDTLAARIEAHFDQHGFGLWTVEIPNVTPFAGFIGLSIPGFDAHFTPCVEIGWRLAAEHWGQGYATEGAQAVLRVRDDRTRRNRLVHRARQPSLTSRHGANWHGARCGRRLRSPGSTRRTAASASCPVQNRTPGTPGGLDASCGKRQRRAASGLISERGRTPRRADPAGPSNGWCPVDRTRGDPARRP